MANAPGPIRQAQRIVAPQYASVDYASRKAQQRSAAEQAALTASGKALVNLLQKGVGPAGQMYDQAVGQQQALAQGAAQLLAQANPNAQIQGDLAQVNAPAEQHALLAHALQAQFPGQGAVLNVQQGAIPGASLVAQKAAEQGYLAGLPTLAALSGQQSLRGLLAKAADQQQALQQQRLQISGQIPTLALGIANTAAQRQAAAASARAEAAYRQAELDARNQSQADLNAYRQNEFTQRNASQASLDRYRSTSQADLKAYRKDLANNRTGGKANPKIISNGGGIYRVNPDGTLTTLKNSPKSGKGNANGLTANARLATVARANTGARQAYQGFTSTDKTPAYTSTTPNDPKGWSEVTKLADGTQVYVNHHPPIGYQEAIRHAREAGIPVSLMLPALNVYYKRGQRGRPQVGFFEATPATRKGPVTQRKRK